MKNRKTWLSWLSIPGLMALVLFGLSGLVFAGSGSGGSQKSMGFGVEGGYVLPADDHFGGTAGIGLSFFYNLSEQFRIELKSGFLPVKAEGDPEGLSKGTLNVIPLQLSLQYRLKLSPRWIPYLGAGVGYYLNNFSVENNDIWRELGFEITEDVDSSFGYHAGVGFDYFFSNRMAFNIDVRYCFTKLTDTYNITEVGSGISHNGEIEKDFNFAYFGAGLKFLF